MGEVKWKMLFYVTVIIGIFVLGFYLGRKTIDDPETKIEIQYLPGEVIRDTQYVDKPVISYKPVDTLGIIQQCIKDGIYSELWPTKTVTEYVEVSKADTTAIMNDWATKRCYTEELFNESINGLCTVSTEVQYNRMRLLGYEYKPVTKTVTETKYVTKLFSPYIGLSYLNNPWDEISNPMIQLNGGFFIKEKYALNIIYQRGLVLKNDYIGGGFLCKF